MHVVDVLGVIYVIISIWCSQKRRCQKLSSRCFIRDRVCGSAIKCRADLALGRLDGLRREK